MFYRIDHTIGHTLIVTAKKAFADFVPEGVRDWVRVSGDRIEGAVVDLDRQVRTFSVRGAR